MAIDFEGQIKKAVDALPQDRARLAWEYVEELRLKKGLREPTIKSHVLTLAPFLSLAENPRSLTAEDVKAYLVSLRENGLSDNSLRLRVLNLRSYLKYRGRAELLGDYRHRRVKRTLPVENVLAPEDVNAMLATVDNQRDRAVIMLFWDSAARMGEIGSLRVKNVEFDVYGGVVYLPRNGEGLKTGGRRIRLVDSVPDLRSWLNMHPRRDDGEAPLFPVARGGKVTPMSNRQLFQIVKKAGRKAGIKKDVSPHKIRHARLTFLAKAGLNEMELRIFAGWEGDSPMPSVYLHIAGADVEDKVLRIAGVELPEDKAKRVKSLEPRKCPRCERVNPHDALFCNCGMVLDPRAAVEMEESRSGLNAVAEIGVREGLINLFGASDLKELLTREDVREIMREVMTEELREEAKRLIKEGAIKI